MTDREVRYRINATDGTSAVLKNIENAAASTATKMVGMKSILGAISGVLGGFTVATVIKSIIDLGIASDKTFRQIAALLPTFTQGMGQLRADVQQFAKDSGRSLQEMQDAAVQIAHLGVGSAEEISGRLKAATELADATGTDLKVVISGLDQVMDLFGVSAQGAEEMLAQMFSAARGRVDFESLLDAFQSVGPILHDMGATAEETTRAIVALLDSGRNAKQVRQIISERDIDSVRLIASQAHIASDALEQMLKATDEVRAGLDRANQRIKDEFSASLTDLGNNVIPKVESKLTTLFRWMTEGLKLAEHYSTMSFKEAHQESLRGPVPDTSSLNNDPSLNRSLAAGAASQNAPPLQLGLTAAQKELIAAQQDEIANLKALNDAYDQSEIAIKELQIAHEALKEKLEHTKQSNLDVRATLDAGTDAIVDQKERALELAIAHALLESTLNKVTAALARTQVAGENAANVTKDIIDVDALLNQGKADLPGILAKNNAAIQKQADDTNKKLDDNLQRIEKVVGAWASVGRSAIGAAQAIGKVDNATAAALQNAVTLGQGIAELYGSGGKAGGPEAVAGLGGLIASITDMGHAASRAQQSAAELAQTIGKLFTGLENEIHGSGSLAARLAGGTSEYADARNTIEKDLGGKAKQTEREEALDRLNKLEAVRLQQITDEYEVEQKQLQEDYHVRLLRAEGFTTEADAEAFAEEQTREWNKALADSGLTAEDFAASATGMGLAAALAAEAISAAADQTRKAAEAALSGAKKKADDTIQIDRITDPGKQFAEKAKAYKEAGGDLGKLFDGFDLDNLSPADIDALDQKLRAFFHTLEDSPGSVDTAGLSIDDLIDSVLDLDGAATKAAGGINAAANSINAALSKLSDNEAIFGTDPQSHAYNTISAEGLFMPGYDLGTKEGKDAAIKYFEDQYRLHPENVEAYKTVLGAIRGIPDPETDASGGSTGSGFHPAGSSSAVAQAFQSLTTVQGNSINDLLFRQLNVQTTMGLDVAAIRQSMVIRVPTFSGVNLSDAGRARSGGGNSPVVISIEPGAVQVNVGDGASPAAIQETVSKALDVVERELDKRFGRRSIVQRKYGGNINVKPS